MKVISICLSILKLSLKDYALQSKVPCIEVVIRSPTGELTIHVPQERGYFDFGVDIASVVSHALGAELYTVIGERDAFGSGREHSCKLCRGVVGCVICGELAVGFGIAGKIGNASSFYSLQ